MSDAMLPGTEVPETRRSGAEIPPGGETAFGGRSPSRLAIWLGLADNSFTRQKTVKFGDASAVNSGRAYSILTLVLLLALWFVATRAGWVAPIYWPSLEAVGSRLASLWTDGFRNVALWDHVSISVYRVLSGVFYGTLVGVPLGFAMGLSSVGRGLFDPIVEFMRPIPPLALIPLIILWFGIDEMAKIVLLFLASLFVMTIAARAGVSSVRISKVHAAYSLGASRWQVLRHVILPNALPEIFTGLRTAMGVCWGTVVAAELVAADRGVGSMIMIAKNFLQTDTVVIGIIIIGLIGYALEIAMRLLESWLIPWKGKG
jgi:taurine transport system permease protein